MFDFQDRIHEDKERLGRIKDLVEVEKERDKKRKDGESIKKDLDVLQGYYNGVGESYTTLKEIQTRLSEVKRVLNIVCALLVVCIGYIIYF